MPALLGTPMTCMFDPLIRPYEFQKLLLFKIFFFKMDHLYFHIDNLATDLVSEFYPLDIVVLLGTFFLLKVSLSIENLYRFPFTSAYLLFHKTCDEA